MKAYTLIRRLKAWPIDLQLPNNLLRSIYTNSKQKWHHTDFLVDEYNSMLSLEVVSIIFCENI